MIRFLKRNKIFSLLCFISLISFIAGVFFYGNLDIHEREVVSHNIQALFLDKNLYLSFFMNYGISLFLIWVLGISIIGTIFILFLFSYMIFIFSFELSAFISCIGSTSFFIILLYMLPKLIMLLFAFLLSYYASLFSYYLFRHLFFHKEYSFPSIMKQYIKIYIFSFIGLIFTTLFEYMNYHYLFQIFY